MKYDVGIIGSGPADRKSTCLGPEMTAKLN